MTTAPSPTPPSRTDQKPPRQKPPWRAVRWGAALGVAVVITIGAVFGSRLGHDATLVNSPLVGRPAPAETLPNLDGTGTLSLASLRGQVVVVNFWASWCVACRQEHPSLTAADSAYRDRGVTFVGVNYQDQRAAAVAFLDDMGRGAGYRYVTDPGSRAAVDFGVFGIPETFFLDRAGTVVAKITGASTYPLLTGVLDDILAGRTPTSHTNGPVQATPTR